MSHAKAARVGGLCLSTIASACGEFSVQRRNLREGHVQRRAARARLPIYEHAAVTICKTELRVNAQAAESAVDPAALSFQLCKVSDRGLVQYQVTIAFRVTELCAELLVPKDGRVTKLDEDCTHGLAVLHVCFGLQPLFVGSGVIVVGRRPLVRHHPFTAVLAHAQDLTAGQQVPIRGVKERVALKGARCLEQKSLPERRLLEPLKVGDAELELDFRLRHGPEYRAVRRGRRCADGGKCTKSVRRADTIQDVNESIPTLRLDSSVPAVERAGDILRGGGLVAIPTETVYGLAAVVWNVAAVERIFAAKGRPHWDPLIVHADERAMVGDVAREIDSASEKLMEAFWPGPLTLLLPRKPRLPAAVTAGRELVAVRIPAHPVARAIIHAAGAPLAAPSANLFGHVSPTTAEHVLADLDGRIDAVVDAGPCGIGVESTVAECTAGEVVVYRAGGVTAAQIEDIAGLPVRMYSAESSSRTPQSLPSPGVGMRHYATRATVVLVHSKIEMESLLAKAEHRDAGVLLPWGWDLVRHAGPVWSWADLEDAAALGEGLYRGLRALDTTGATEIVVPLPPTKTGLFAALHDRLEKAARPE